MTLQERFKQCEKTRTTKWYKARGIENAFMAAYKKPVRVTRQGDHGVVMMSEKEYKKLLKEANK